MNVKRLFCGILLCITHQQAFSQTTERLPKWEAGIGVAGLTIADYRGSEEYRNRVFPIPFFVYRGKIFKADRNGLRGDFFSSKRFELKVSANASLGGTDDNPLREGMPEIDPSFEPGPTLNINLTGPNHEQGWLLRLPARAVFAFGDDGIDHIGWLAQPNLAFIKRFNDWKLGYSAGVYFADNQYHDYYYAVDSQFATATRPAFQVASGYSGFSNQLNLSRRAGNLWYGGYIRYDNLSGADFVDSPLVETENYFTLGFGVSWIFGRSKQFTE